MNKRGTFTLEPLPHQPPQHLPTEVTEGGRLVGMDIEHVRPDLDLIRGVVSCQEEE